MGVRDLWPILEPVGQPVGLSDLQGKKVAIDLSIWIRQSDVITAVKKPYLSNIFWRLLHLLQYQVTPILIIEGTAPTLKHAELERRLHGTPRKKSIVNRSPKLSSPRGTNAVFQQQIRECCQMFDALGVCYVYSDGEAETTCAQLNMHGLVDGCVTQDGDAFLFGAHTVYKDFTCDNQKRDEMSVYQMADIQSELGLTRRHLVSLALLIGCDYYNGVKSVGSKNAQEFIAEINDKDPIDTLKQLKTGEFYKKLKELDCTPKGRHCLRCQHPGGKDVHKRLGCTHCKGDKGCTDNKSDESCPCQFHKNKRILAKHAMCMKIRKFIMNDEEFPPQQVVDAFLKPAYRAPSQELEWTKPSMEALKDFNRTHLHWGQDKVEARFVPLLTAWDLSHPEDMSLLPLRILKILHERGEKMIEVEWKYEDTSLQVGESKTVTTREHYDIMCDVHPDLVEGFEAERREAKIPKTPAKRRLEKAAATSHSLMDMFKVKKPRTESALVAENAVKEESAHKPTESMVKNAKSSDRVSLFNQFEGLLSRSSKVEQDATGSTSPTVSQLSKLCPKTGNWLDHEVAIVNEKEGMMGLDVVCKTPATPVLERASSSATRTIIEDSANTLYDDDDNRSRSQDTDDSDALELHIDLGITPEATKSKLTDTGDSRVEDLSRQVYTVHDNQTRLSDTLVKMSSQDKSSTPASPVGTRSLLPVHSPKAIPLLPVLSYDDTCDKKAALADGESSSTELIVQEGASIQSCPKATSAAAESLTTGGSYQKMSTKQNPSVISNGDTPSHRHIPFTAPVEHKDTNEDNNGYHSEQDIFVVNSSNIRKEPCRLREKLPIEHNLSGIQIKSKGKSRKSKKLKASVGQKKISDMFSVKTREDVKGLKMVLVRNSDS